MNEQPEQPRTRPVTPQQELLLKAALLAGPQGLAAWEQWSREVDAERLDYDSYRLLPLLYSTLQRNGISDPQMGRLKGIYRRAWYDNTLRFHDAATILRALHAAGIRTMLLKGPALALRYYPDIGLRPMDDFDILVPTDQRFAAIETLKALGWTPFPEGAGLTETEALTSGHAYPFRNARGQEVDLHWHVFYQRVSPAADAEMWSMAAPIMLHGAPTQVLHPADQLLHVCVHGTQMLCWWRPGEATNARWIADAMMILRHAPARIDGDRLLALARRLHYLTPVRNALRYLSDVFDAPVPGDVTRRLDRLRVSLAERIAEHTRSHPPKRWGPWVALGWRYLEYSSAFPADVGLIRRLAGLPGFFQQRWGRIPLWLVPFVAIVRGLRRILWAAEGDRRHSARWSTTKSRF
jgi:hypothetical protein